MKRISIQWHGPRSGEALRRLLVQGRTFAALAVCSCVFFVAARLAGMAVGEVYQAYRAMLDRYHCLTFSLIIQCAVESLQDPEIGRAHV